MGNFTGKKWSPERIERLRELWNGGDSASQIAAILCAELREEFSRNSVIGAAHRAGLVGRPSPIGKSHAPTNVHRTKKARAISFHSTGPRVQPASNRIAVSTANRARAEKRRTESPLTSIQGGHPDRASNAAALKVRESVDPVRNGIRSGQSAAERRLSGDVAPRRSISLHEPKSIEPVVDDGKRNVAFADLRSDGCKFATTPHHVRPDQHKFCAAPRVGDSPYCETHTEKSRGKSVNLIEVTA